MKKKKTREKFPALFGLLAYTLHVGGKKPVCEYRVLLGEPVVIGPFGSNVKISDVGLVAAVFKHPIPFPEFVHQMPMFLGKGAKLTININGPVLTLWPEG
jgi:hypothetical protein